MFFVADWHALTTHYEEPEVIEDNVWQMVIDWLASGVNPGSATLLRKLVLFHQRCSSVTSLRTSISS